MSEEPASDFSGLAPGPPALPPGVLAVRLGAGANCSSIGSAVEMLFLSAAVGAAVLAAVSAAIQPHGAEPVDAHAGEPAPTPPAPAPGDEPEDPTEAG